MPSSLLRVLEQPSPQSTGSGDIEIGQGTELTHLAGDHSHHSINSNSVLEDGTGVSERSQLQSLARPPLGSRSSSVASFVSAQLQRPHNPVSAFSSTEIVTFDPDNDPSPHSVPAVTGDISSSPFLPLSPATSHHLPIAAASGSGSEMIFHEHMDHLEIALASDNLVLRGVGQNYEPAVLSGNVILHLPESTNIREINLSFTGKARMPQGDSRQPHVRHHQATHSIYQHDWSFLEGAKNHRHTLKAGKHVFPFLLNIDSTVPSSLSTTLATISYKLRATVVRSSFSSNWVATRNIEIVRAFTSEALEYNQTLEIENTWPGKVMYSVLIPHKAYAAGDEIPVLMKFTPMTKGVNVVCVDTTLKEYSAVKGKGLQVHQDSKIVAKAKHFFQDGNAVDLSCIGNRPMEQRSNRFSRASGGSDQSYRPNEGHESSSSLGQAEGSQDQPVQGDGEIDTSLRLSIPKSVTPTHGIDPITVTHKIKWSIMISNLDGHTSELRCALPVHILSHVLLDEARSATREARNILFGLNSSSSEATQLVNLPSYASHVHDRVANAFDGVPSSLSLAPNPLHNLDSSNTSPSGSFLPTPGGSPSSGSGGFFHAVTNYISGNSNSGHAHSSPFISPGSRGLPTNLDDPMGLEYVDSGLLLSLGGSATASVSRNSAGSSARGSMIGSLMRVDTPPGSAFASRRESRASSRANSRASSRAASPERGFESLARSTSGQGGSGSTTTLTSHGHKDSTHGSSHKSGGFHFSLGLKPFTPFGKSHNKNGTSIPIHGAGVSALHQHSTFTIPASPPSSRNSLSRPPSRPSTRPPSRSNLRADYASSDPHGSGQQYINPEAISQLLSHVPDYEQASRGFLGGGVTPLDASRGLPSYDEVERVSRVRSEGSLLEFRRRHNPRDSLSGISSTMNGISLSTSHTQQPQEASTSS